MNNRSILVMACLLLFSSIAVAQVRTSGLTDEQKAQLALQAAQMKAQNENHDSIVPSNIDPEKLNEWVDLGKNIGVAVAATAKELGVAADEFLGSTTGKITVVLIVWKVMGEDILDLVGGTVAWFLLTGIILWSFKFFHMSVKIVAKETGAVSYVRRYEFKGNDARICSVVAHAASFLLFTIICMTIIF